jgi:carbamate kinase
MKTAVIAIGGNAILPRGSDGGVTDQRRRVRATCRVLADLIEDGYDIALTHGNGPQVGNALLRQEAGKRLAPPMPLDVCVAETQAEIGYLLQRELRNELGRRGLRRNVTAIVTQVRVDARDPAFRNPTKPVGPYYSATAAKDLRRRKRWRMVYDERGGWRRVVPSPRPLEIVETPTIRRLLFTGTSDEVVIVAGGGGIPVVLRRGQLVGVEAVVDKDLAAGVLATGIGEKLFLILTDVPHVSLDFGTPRARRLGRVTAAELRRHWLAGQFPEGSMGPKVEAALLFLENGGERVVITNMASLRAALAGKAGTIATGR